MKALLAVEWALLMTFSFVLYTLFHYYVTIILVISKIRIGTWVCIHCRKLANQHIHHRESVSIQTKSIRYSTIKHQSVFPYYVSCSNRSGLVLLMYSSQPARNSELNLSPNPSIVPAMAELFSCQTCQ